MNLLASLSQVVLLLQRLGIRGVFARIPYEFRRLSGTYRRGFPLILAPAIIDDAPLTEIQMDSLSSRLRQIWPMADLRDAEDSLFAGDRTGSREYLLECASKIKAGIWPWYSTQWFPFTGGHDWRRNPRTGKFVSTKQHWSQLRFDDPQSGDLKDVLEPHRFGWAVTLAQAYLLTHDEELCEYFWTVLEDWVCWNPPAGGVAYLCGQECAIRMMSWTFAVSAFLLAEHTTDRRLGLFASLMVEHSHRIEVTMPYALSQKNNHSMSETTGLALGLFLFPEHEYRNRPGAFYHQRKFKYDAVVRLFVDECERMVAPDGSFAQESLSYHRLAMQLLMQMLQILKADAGCDSSSVDRLRICLRKLSGYLLPLIEPSTGHVPNLGANDGAWLFPVAGSITDYRPVVQASFGVLGQVLPFESGPWDAELILRNGVPVLGASDAQNDQQAVRGESFDGIQPLFLSDGGLAFLDASTSLCSLEDNGRQAAANTRAILRVSTPNRFAREEDRMHAVLWGQGKNLAIDPGTYAYYGSAHARNESCLAVPMQVNHELATATFHNLVTIEGRDVLPRQGLFFWDDKLGCRISALQSFGPVGYVEACHRDWCGLGLCYRRGILQASLSRDDLGCAPRGAICAAKEGGDTFWWIRDVLIPDQIVSHANQKELPFRLHWLFADGERKSAGDGDDEIVWDNQSWRIACRGRMGCSNEGAHQENGVSAWNDVAVSPDWVRADPQSLRGWHCPTYGLKCPAWSMTATLWAQAVCFDTVIASAGVHWQFDDDKIRFKSAIQGAWSLVVDGAGDTMPGTIQFAQQNQETACWPICRGPTP